MLFIVDVRYPASLFIWVGRLTGLPRSQYELPRSWQARLEKPHINMPARLPVWNAFHVHMHYL